MPSQRLRARLQRSVSGVDIGALRIDNLADANIQIIGTRKIGKETLPVVSIRYPKAGKSPVQRPSALWSVRQLCKRRFNKRTNREPYRLIWRLSWCPERDTSSEWRTILTSYSQKSCDPTRCVIV